LGTGESAFPLSDTSDARRLVFRHRTRIARGDYADAVSAAHRPGSSRRPLTPRGQKAKDGRRGVDMNMRKWWPYLTIGAAAVIVSVAYPVYFRWWDHRSCHDSGGEWNSAQHECIEPRNTNIPATEGSKTFEDDNQDAPNRG
jgi:hypothetical protein